MRRPYVAAGLAAIAAPGYADGGDPVDLGQLGNDLANAPDPATDPTPPEADPPRRSDAPRPPRAPYGDRLR